MAEVGTPAPESQRAGRQAMRARFVLPFFVAYLVVQIGLPAALLFAERPARFGWQMFAGVRRLPAFMLVHADGSTRRAPPLSTGHRRDDLDYRRHAPAYLCARFADAVAVRVDGEDAPCAR